MLLQESNRPYNIEYALYINGQLIPATSVSVSTDGNTVNMGISIAPTRDTFRLGSNNRVHAALFIKDNIYFKDKPKWVLFWEGEITGQTFYRDSSSANVSFSVEPIDVTTFGRVKIRSMFNNQAGILSPTALPMPLTDVLLMMGGFPSASFGKAVKDVKVDASIKVPYDFVSSMFMFFFSVDNNFQTEAIKSFRSAYMAAYFMKHVYMLNLIRKIVPDPSQVPGFYSAIMGQMSLAYLTRAMGTQTDGSILDVIKAAIGAFYHVMKPITLPPLVKIKRVTAKIETGADGAVLTSKAHYKSEFDEYMSGGFTENKPGQSETESQAIVSEGNVTYDISRLFYNYEDGNEYLAEFVVMPEILFRAIPRFNLIISPFCRVVLNNFYYMRPTRGYTYYTMGASNPNELLITAYPPIAHMSMQNNVFMERFISEEESNKGPLPVDSIAPPFWIFMAGAPAQNLSKWFLVGGKQAEFLNQVYGGNSSGNKEVGTTDISKGINDLSTNNSVLMRYAWNSLLSVRYGVNRASINLDYPNIYIVAGLPLLFIDPERPECCFVGTVSSVSWNFSSTGSSTSIEVINVVPIDEYFREIINSNMYAHDDFITPAPHFLPIMDQAWQTLKGANYNYGMMFFRGRGPAVLDVSDFVGFDDGENIIKFKYGIDDNSEHLSKDNIRFPLGVIDSEIYNSFDRYMEFISRPGTTMNEYVRLMPYGEISGDYEGKPVSIFNMENDESFDGDLQDRLTSYFIKSINNIPERS